MTAIATPHSRTRAALHGTLAYASAWLPFIAVYIGVLTAMTGGTWPVTRIVIAALLNALGPAVMGAFIWWISARLSWPDRGGVVFLAAHAMLAITYAVGWMAWQYAIAGPVGPVRVPSYAVLRYVLPWQAAIGFILYGVVAGVSYAVRGVLRSRDLRVAAERAERLRAEAELAQLRAHMNPHFFFSTLHAVSQLMRSDPERAQTAIEQLSDLFRYVLRLDRYQVELVTLDDEWRFTQRYLWLEQLRMGSRLVVRTDIEDDALEYAVPPFTLQPLVENAVRHGLEPKRGGGTVRVAARARNGMLELMISDDGVGADPDARERETGVGVRVITQLLSARFGSAAHARVVTAPGRGYAVTLSFPAASVMPHIVRA